MNALPTIKQACLEAVEEEQDDVPAWRAAYIAIVDPLSVLELASHLDELLAHADQTAPELAARIRAAAYPRGQ